MNANGKRGLFIILLLAALVFTPVYSCIKQKEMLTRRWGRYGRFGDLKQIGWGIIQYSSEQYYGKMPQSLWDLYDDGDGIISDAGVIACPADIEPQPMIGPWELNRYYYLYEGKNNVTKVAANEPIVVYPHGEEELNGFTVLFGDGHVRYLNAEDFLAQYGSNLPGGNDDE